MVRIKGVNSDYEYSTEKGKILEKHPDQLYMRIFICPNNQPSAIDQREKDQACCEGKSASCPGDKKSGHAAITLHQKEGISLQTDQAQLQLEQDGSLVLKSSQGQIAKIRASENGWEFCSNGASLKIDKNGNLELASANGKTITFKGDVNIQGDIQGKLLETIKTMVDNAFKQK
ncbi:hypothetical protein [Nostoc sp. ChiQUE01b]|uniref:hypothetical protein n=1 Tax=Nostoc sp. ChiQUE01b TaxID=3075376 RepID=UPI002AD2BDA6|nr:hypothetical protein [Nostoc sp. ChiQUE01b]MDZ8263313.1 hypothetical protein [Nostoc sp. ChiQUE01b]